MSALPKRNRTASERVLDKNNIGDIQLRSHQAARDRHITELSTVTPDPTLSDMSAIPTAQPPAFATSSQPPALATSPQPPAVATSSQRRPRPAVQAEPSDNEGSDDMTSRETIKDKVKDINEFFDPPVKGPDGSKAKRPCKLCG